MSKDDMWPEVTVKNHKGKPETVKSIVRTFLDNYDRHLVGTDIERRLVRMLENINR